MKKSSILAGIISASLCLTFFVSCGKKVDVTEESPKSDVVEDESKDIKYIDQLYNVYDTGRIFYEKPITYTDYDTQKKSIVCALPNCNHTISSCLGNSIGECPMLADDGIYFFNSKSGVEELGNGTRRFFIESKLCYV